MIKKDFTPGENIPKKFQDFIEKIRHTDLPNSKVMLVGTVGNGCTGIEEFNKPEYPKTLRIVFESSFGEDSLIKSELWLPENWNGEFLGLGNGGYGGSLVSKYWTYTTQGFATAETDMGTSRLVSDEIMHFSLDVLKDYSWRSTHIMTVVCKKLIELYYGKAPVRSFFMGSSAGGLQAYSEAQRFPEDYDGIFGGVPSNNTLNFKIYNLWLHHKLVREDFKPHFNVNDAERITELAVNFFRARGDGEEDDDFITFPYTDENTVDDFISYLKKEIPEFTEEQFNALRDVYNGPVHQKNGKQLYSGLPIGSEIFCNYMVKDKYHPQCTEKWLDRYFGFDFNLLKFDFADDYERLLSDFAPHYSANNPDLSEFMKRGGKLLSYSGAADRSGSFADTMKYYNRVCEKLGGYERVSCFFRHFTLPGKAHGNQGKGANVYCGKNINQTILDTLREWCITGVGPEHLTVGHQTEEEDGSVHYKFIRRVYPYRADMVEGKDFPKTTDDKYLDIPQYKE